MQPGAYPWMVALLTESEPDATKAQFCGGSLIAPDRVLTAAHCVSGMSANQIDVLVGRERLSDKGGRRIRVRSYAMHPKSAKRDNDESMKNDVALLFLEQPASVTPITPITDADLALMAAGTPLRGIGWGNFRTYTGTPFAPATRVAADRLREVDLPAVSDDGCENAYGVDFDGESMLCAGGAEKDVCNGDSGGPLVGRLPSGELRLVGVTSWGYDCAVRDAPGVFARVLALRGFITSARPVIAPVSRARPTIRGRVVVGGRLTCNAGRWGGSPANIDHSWFVVRKRSGPPPPAGIAADRSEFGGLDIVRTVASRRRSITVSSELEGDRLACVVTQRNAGGSGQAASSPTAKIPVR